MPSSPASTRKSARRLPSRLRKTGEAPTGELKRLRDEAAATAIARDRSIQQAEAQRADRHADSAPTRRPKASRTTFASDTTKSEPGGTSMLDHEASTAAPEDMVEIEVEIEDVKTEFGANARNSWHQHA